MKSDVTTFINWRCIMKYKIVKPIIDSTDIIGYEVIDDTGNIKRFKLEDLYKLIEAGIVECTILNDSENDKHILYDKVDVSDSITYHVESRIVRDNKLAGYICTKSDGASCKLSPNKVWELAAEGLVDNVSAIVVNNQITLVGKGISILDLSTLKI